MNAVVGYDPLRIHALRHHTRAAVDDLASIHCDDPFADDALRAVRLLRSNLEETWLPHVEAICASRALVTWRRVLERLPGGPSLTGALVGQLGATSAWVATNGLDHLSDERLVDELRHEADAIGTALALGGDDLSARSRSVRRLSDELVRRATADPDGAVGPLAWGMLGPSGLRTLAETVDALAQADARGHLDELATDGSSIAGLVAAVGLVATGHPAADDVVADVARSSTHLARELAEHSVHLSPATLVAVTSGLLASLDGGGTIDHRPSIGPLLRAIVHDPGSALDLLGSADATLVVVTDRHLDDDAVEDVVASALTAPLVEPGRAGSALAVLADLVALAQDRDLNVGARRGVARSIGVQLPLVSPQLDRRYPVDVPTADGTEVVRLGTYDEVARLIGQIVDDVDAQTTLGVTVAAFRADRLDRVAATIEEASDDGELGPVAARDRVSASLADVSRVLVLIERGVDDRNDLLEFRHAAARHRGSTIVGLLGNAVGWWAPGGTVVSRVSSLGTRVITTAYGPSEPPTVPDTGFAADAAVDGLVTAVVLPLGDRAVRTALGLDRVPDAVWRDLDELVDEIEQSDDPDERAQLRSRIRAVVDSHPDLDAYVELLAVDSSDTRLS